SLAPRGRGRQSARTLVGSPRAIGIVAAPVMVYIALAMEQPGSLTYNAGGASFRRGWPLTLAATVATATLCSFAYTATRGGLDGWSSVVRTSAKTSLLFFLGAFVASSVRVLWRTPATAWLLANRRYVGVSFATSHFIHLIGILMVAKLSPDFERSTVTLIF